MKDKEIWITENVLQSFSSREKKEDVEQKEMKEIERKKERLKGRRKDCEFPTKRSETISGKEVKLYRASIGVVVAFGVAIGVVIGVAIGVGIGV